MPPFRLPASLASRLSALQQRMPAWRSAPGLHRPFIRAGRAEAAKRDLPAAGTDSLTGLPNRSWLMACLPRAIEAAAGRGGTMAILFIDLDDFKLVNERCGRDGGDALLRAAAARLGSTIRAGDLLARLGGDEFMVVLEGTEQVEAALVAGRIVEAMAMAFGPGSPACSRVRASVGISLYPRDGAALPALLRHADLAMYMAKSSGKGRYAFHAAAAGADQPCGGAPRRRGRSGAVSRG
jgi:diguanylate cyclase (GGDEF)-like protein